MNLLIVINKNNIINNNIKRIINEEIINIIDNYKSTDNSNKITRSSQLWTNKQRSLNNDELCKIRWCN